MSNTLSVIWKILMKVRQAEGYRLSAFLRQKLVRETCRSIIETMQNDTCGRRTEDQYFLDSTCGYYTLSPIYFTILSIQYLV